MPQVAVRSEHTLISSMRMSPDRTVYGCVLAEVLSSGWRWPDLRLGIRLWGQWCPLGFFRAFARRP